MALTDAAGNVAATYEYDEWGNVTSSTGNIDTPFGYAGQYGYVYDKETGLYFLKSRYYDPATGRFTSRDRFKGFENRPASQNPYTYCENDPVNKVDPEGFYSHWYSGGYEWYEKQYTFGRAHWLSAHAAKFAISVFISFVTLPLRLIPRIGKAVAAFVAYVLGESLPSIPPCGSRVTSTFRRKLWTDAWYGRTVIVAPDGRVFFDSGRRKV